MLDTYTELISENSTSKCSCAARGTPGYVREYARPSNLLKFCKFHSQAVRTRQGLANTAPQACTLHNMRNEY